MKSPSMMASVLELRTLVIGSIELRSWWESTSNIAEFVRVPNVWGSL